jgi:hypothetical protein
MTQNDKNAHFVTFSISMNCENLNIMNRVRFPSPAPFQSARHIVPKCDNSRHLSAFYYFSSLHQLRQPAPRLDPLGLKSVGEFMYTYDFAAELDFLLNRESAVAFHSGKFSPVV